MKPIDPLTSLLSRLTPPPPDPAARDRALCHATLALGGAAASTTPPPALGWVRSALAGKWALAGMAAVIVLAGVWRTGNPGSWTGRPRAPLAAGERRMLDQIEALFGPQLDAVVERSGAAPDIRLTSDPAMASPADLAQPVLVEFDRSGSQTTRVISYSGRTVCLTLAGRPVCFEPLVTGQGEVILSGERFCWLPDRPADGLTGYRITARLLPRS